MAKPKTRTYYLLFDGKTITSHRPDVKAKALVQACNKLEASAKLHDDFDYDPTKKIFTTRKPAGRLQAPSTIPAVRRSIEVMPHEIDPKKVLKNAEADLGKEYPREPGPMEEALSSLGPDKEEPGEVPASRHHAIVFEGTRIILPKGMLLTISTEGDLVIQASKVKVNGVYSGIDALMA